MKLKSLTLRIASGFTAGALVASAATDAHANDFTNVTQNITDSSADLPNLLATVAYVGGAGLGIAGIYKLKQHVDAPQQTPMKDGLIRLGAGGGLLALPIVLEAMSETIGAGGTTPTETLTNINTMSF